MGLTTATTMNTEDHEIRSLFLFTPQVGHSLACVGDAAWETSHDFLIVQCGAVEAFEALGLACRRRFDGEDQP